MDTQVHDQTTQRSTDLGTSSPSDFAEFCGLDTAFVIEGVENYNRDFSAYGNEVYHDLRTRVAHWVNYLNQGWFQRRLDPLLVHAAEFDTVLDLGWCLALTRGF